MPTMSPARTGSRVEYELTSIGGLTTALVPAPVNVPPPSGRTTRSAVWTPGGELPALMLQATITPLEGTTSEEAPPLVNHVQVSSGGPQGFVSGVPVVEPI